MLKGHGDGAGPATVIAGAQVTVVGTTTVVTTSENGTFTLERTAVGHARGRDPQDRLRQGVADRAPRRDAPVDVRIVLDQATVLGTVHVVSKMDDGLSKLGFLSRKQQGRGWYLTPEQIAEKNPLMTTDLFRMASGMRVMDGGAGRYLTSNSSAGSTQDGCINVFIDHARFDQYQPGDVDDAVPDR